MIIMQNGSYIYLIIYIYLYMYLLERESHICNNISMILSDIINIRYYY